jgi:3,4-dihydroxy 2-butanone 4-phosphate synthase / GTP cyclohydrolase II
MLTDLGVHSFRLLTNNPAKVDGLSGFGISVTGRVGLPSAPTPHNLRYLTAKRDRLGHQIDYLPGAADGPAGRGLETGPASPAAGAQ